MPISDKYQCRVRLVVVLENTHGVELAQYAVRGAAEGWSYDRHDETAETLSGVLKVVEAATLKAVVNSKAMAAGVQNVERRRLK